MYNGIAISLFDPEQVPKSALLLNKMISIFMVFRNSLNAFKKTDRALKGGGVALKRKKFLIESLSEFDMKVLRNFRSINRVNIHILRLI